MSNIKHEAKKTETKRGNLIFRKPKKRFSQTKNKSLPVEQVLHLQRTIGNWAVNRLIQSGAIQTKLTIGKPNDMYEKEAERVADRVMSMKDGALVNGHSSLAQRKSTCPECPERKEIQSKPLAEQITPLVQRQPEEEEAQTKLLVQRQKDEEEKAQTKLLVQRQEEEKEEAQTKPLIQRQAEEEEKAAQTKLLQRQEGEEEKEAQTKLQRQAEEEEKQAQPKAAPGNAPRVIPKIESSINEMKGGGQPLSESTRSFFEPRFGADFSQVRVHTDGKAGEIARSINAKAFTTGKNIVFNSGQYLPGTSSGKRLLAHELTHVVQQGAARPKNSRVRSGLKIIQRAAPAAAAGAAGVTIGAVAAKCIIGAIVGALFDAGLQAALYSWRKKTFRFWKVKLNYCNIILSAILGCIAAPISAYILEPWIAAKLGAKLGGIAGTLIGRILLFIAKKLGMTIPKGILGTLLKLKCISSEQAAELGVRL